MPRFGMTVEYDGTGFVGWQRQANGPSVQQAIETAIAAVCGEQVEVVGAGRTDAGVHARGMVAHVDLETDRFGGRTLLRAVNFHLGAAPVALVAVEQVDPAFHARFSATRRHYRYRVLNRPAPPVLDRNRVWHVPVPLDAAAMANAAAVLVGRHDFSSFRASGCQARSPCRTLDRLDVRRSGDEIFIDAEARSFLYRQVRNMVGSLGLVGQGKWSREDMAAALRARSRTAAGPAAPAAGLSLEAIHYAGCGQGGLYPSEE